MKTILQTLAVAVLLVVAPSWSYALESIEIVTKERAKALGLEIRSNAAGPDAVRIELEFAIQGELKDYHRVALELHNGEKLLATLSRCLRPSGVASFLLRRIASSSISSRSKWSRRAVHEREPVTRLRSRTSWSWINSADEPPNKAVNPSGGSGGF